MTRARRLAVLAAVCLAVLAINIDTTIVNVALPSLTRELGATTRDLQWVVDGYNLAFAALVLAAGSLSDRYGRRPALLTGLLGFALSSGLGALARGPGELIAVRVVMGTFAALIFPTTLSIISNAFTERKARAGALGVWGATVGLGVALGPVTGGALLTHFFWGSVFLALVPLALLAAAAAAVVVPESRDPQAPALDRRGLLLASASVGLLVYTVIEAPARGWGSPATEAGLVLAAVLAGLFVRVEMRAAHPMLDVALFRDRRFTAASGAVTLAFFALFGFIFLVTQYFQLVRGYDALSTGARILPVALSLAAASVLGAQLAPRVGTKVVVATGLALLGSAFLWVSTASATTPYRTVIVGQMVLIGIGMGLVSTPATESILLVLPPARAGVGSAVNDATRELGGTLGVAVVGSVFASIYTAHLAGSGFAQLGGRALAAASSSVGAAFQVAAAAPASGQGALRTAASQAFLAGMHVGCLVVGVVCLLGAVGAAAALPGRVRQSEPAQPAAGDLPSLSELARA